VLHIDNVVTLKVIDSLHSPLEVCNDLSLWDHSREPSREGPLRPVDDGKYSHSGTLSRGLKKSEIWKWVSLSLRSKRGERKSHLEWIA